MSTLQYIEQADVVFIKVDDGIYLIHKCREKKDRTYVGHLEVVDALEFKKVAIFSGGETGKLIHRNFEIK